METSLRPEIFVLSFDKVAQQSFEAVHDHLFHALAAKAYLRRAANARESLRLFNDNNCPSGVLITDSGIVTTTNTLLSQKLSKYVRHGGTLVLGGLFSTAIRPSDLGRYMKKAWGLPWEAGSYHRTTVYLNELVINRTTSGIIMPSYSQKAVFLKNVDPEMAWYTATYRSVLESRVPFLGSKVDIMETPVAFAGIGSGWIGYIGDANGEEGTTAVVLEILGLNRLVYPESRRKIMEGIAD